MKTTEQKKVDFLGSLVDVLQKSELQPGEALAVLCVNLAAVAVSMNDSCKTPLPYNDLSYRLGLTIEEAVIGIVNNKPQKVH